MTNDLAILIVDDSEIDRMILSYHLNSMGVSKIHECVDGAKALEYLRQKLINNSDEQALPSIIFLDLQMPDIDGFGFLEAFVDIYPSFDDKSCQIIVYSSSDSLQDKTHVFAYPFVKGYLVKGKSSFEEIEQAMLALE